MQKVFSVNNISYTVLKGKSMSLKSEKMEDVLIVLHKIGCCCGIYQNIVRNHAFESLTTNKDFKMVCDCSDDWDSTKGTEILENGESLIDWIEKNYRGW
ncbi:MAG: hypothetical protein Q4E53_12890 [Eubacteriales bacterium]|nr:hypothetical protein [Eubacteriales bacterium]